MIFVAVLMRFIPHPANLVPINAMALFAGAQLQNTYLAIFLVLSSMFVSDYFLGFHSTMPAVYACLMITTFLGSWLLGHGNRAQKEQKNAQNFVTLPRLVATIFLSSIVFFLGTNLAVWAFQSLYPKTLSGLLLCYVEAIPFFENSLVGDLVYSLIFFGGLSFIEKLSSHSALGIVQK